MSCKNKRLGSRLQRQMANRTTRSTFLHHTGSQPSWLAWLFASFGKFAAPLYCPAARPASTRLSTFCAEFLLVAAETSVSKALPREHRLTIYLQDLLPIPGHDPYNATQGYGSNFVSPSQLLLHSTHYNRLKATHGYQGQTKRQKEPDVPTRQSSKQDLQEMPHHAQPPTGALKLREIRPQLRWCLPKRRQYSSNPYLHPH